MASLPGTDLNCENRPSRLRFLDPHAAKNPKTEIDFACDPHRKGEERKPVFSTGIFLPDPLIVSGWGVKFVPPPAFERF